MDSLIPARKRRLPISIQLTAMIDIFAMIIIFLMKGAVFGSLDIAIPENVRVPESVSKEAAESAPRVVIASGRVRFDAAPAASAPLQDYGSEQIREALAGYVRELPSQARSAGVLLNVVADRETPYRSVYDVIRVFRQAGFETMLFVATGREGR